MRWNNKIYYIALITVIIYFLMDAQYGEYLVQQYGTQQQLVFSLGQYYRLVTCIFAHGSIMHLVVNMIALISLAQAIKIIYNEKLGIIIYIIAGIISSLAVTLLTSNFTVGSSGAIYSLLGLLLYKAYRDYKMGYKENLNALLPIIMINLVISFMPGISLIGHLAGLVTGLVAGYIYYMKFNRRGFF